MNPEIKVTKAILSLLSEPGVPSLLRTKLLFGVVFTQQWGDAFPKRQELGWGLENGQGASTQRSTFTPSLLFSFLLLIFITRIPDQLWPLDILYIA